MTTFTELFRQGFDTAQIAHMTGETEAIVYNMMYRERLLSQPHMPQKRRRDLVAYWNGTGE